jgi:hypothetical protein
VKSKILAAVLSAALVVPVAVDRAFAQAALPGTTDLQLADVPTADALLAPTKEAAKPAATAPVVKPAAAVKPAPALKKAKAKRAKKPTVTATPLKAMKKSKKTKSAKAEPLPAFVDQPQDNAKLTGSAAWAKLIGNSVTGMYDGKALVDAYLPDGTVKTKLGDTIQTGRWGLVDNKVCFSYEGAAESACWAIEVDGAAVTLTSPDGENVLLSMAAGLPTDF